MHKTHKKHILETYHPQSGRSMVEMLGSMAIMGVLSVGAIGGYSYAMNKHRTNELIYEATKRAQWVGTQLELNRNPANLSILGFGTNKFAGGEIYGVSDLIDNQFEIQIQDVTEAVCENLIRNSGDNNIIRFVVNPDTHEEISTGDCTDSIKVGLVFNRDLSTNDPAENPEVSGEVSGEATGTGPAPEATGTAGSCNGRGTWGDFGCGFKCRCDSGWAGEDCSVDHTCSGNGHWEIEYCVCERGWSSADCSVEQDVCNGRGYLVNLGCGASCHCENGWRGNDCSSCPSGDCAEIDDSPSTATVYEPEETATATVISGDAECNYHGSWCGSMCNCNRGWGGSDCSEDHTNDCSGRGNWYQWLNNGAGGCECQFGWGGSDCSVQNPCGEHGYWNYYMGRCSCYTSWVGSDCSEDGNALYCNSHGSWCGSSCSCYSGWGGDDCSRRGNPECNYHGEWFGSYCNCYDGYQGNDCSDDSLRTYCSNHGYLNSSDCLCDSGWGGADCSVQNPCSGHGYWENCGGDMYCVCEIGWGGSDCSEEADSPSPEMSVVTTTGGYEPEETATVTVQNNNDHSCSGNGYWDD